MYVFLYFLSFWDFEQKVFGLFFEKNFAGVVKTAFYIFLGTVWEKTMFWKP